MARGRTQNETTVNGTILQNSFHSAVQCEFILFKDFFIPNGILTEISQKSNWLYLKCVSN